MKSTGSHLCQKVYMISSCKESCSGNVMKKIISLWYTDKVISMKTLIIKSLLTSLYQREGNYPSLAKRGEGRFFNNVVLLITALVLLTFLCACTPQKEKIYRKSKILMDTFVTITVVSNSEDSAGKAIDNAFSEIERLEKLSNFFSSESEGSRIKKNE